MILSCVGWLSDDGGMAVKRNMLLGKQTTYSNYEITFDVYPLDKVPIIGTLLRGSSTDHDCCNEGDRNPLIYFMPETYLLVLEVTTAIGRQYVRSTVPLVENQWSAVHVSMEGTLAFLTVNSPDPNFSYRMHITNVFPRLTYEQQNFYASDNFIEYEVVLKPSYDRSSNILIFLPLVICR